MDPTQRDPRVEIVPCNHDSNAHKEQWDKAGREAPVRFDTY